MPAQWIDFTALKRQVSIRDVLARYGFLDALAAFELDDGLQRALSVSSG